jgi:hypothetical protein
MATHPSLNLITAELTRAESDLTGFRSRALTVVTTSAGVVTLLTGLVTFAASKASEDAGVDDASVVLIAIALAGFVLAGVLALAANRARVIRRPRAASLQDAVTSEGWYDNESETEHERAVASVLVTYLISVRTAADATARTLNRAIACQIFGLVFAAGSAVWTITQL